MEGGEEQLGIAMLERMIGNCMLNVPDTPKLNPLNCCDPVPFAL
jgi:hypothetical protein